MTTVQSKVIAGSDAHADTNHIALMRDYGKRLGVRKFLAVGFGYQSGYQEITAYLTSFCAVIAVSIGGNGSYGTEHARVLSNQGFTVREMNQSNRFERCLRGKSDTLTPIKLLNPNRRSVALPRPKRVTDTSKRCG